MSEKSAPFLQIELKKSASLPALIGVTHLLAAVAVELTSIIVVLKVFLWLAILVSLMLSLFRKDCAYQTITRLAFKGDKGWSFWKGELETGELELLSSAVSTRFCLFLHFCDSSGEKHALFIPRDAMKLADYQRLRACLNGVYPV